MENVVASDNVTGGGAYERFRRKVRAGGDAGKGDGRCRSVGHVRQPLVLFVAPRKHRSNRETHHRVAGGKAAAFAERTAVALEEGVGIRAAVGSIERALAARDRFEDD